MDRAIEATRRVLRVAGGVALLISGVPALTLFIPDGVGSGRFLSWLVALSVFGVSFWLTTRSSLIEGGPRGWGGLAIQELAVVGMILSFCTGLEWTLMAVIIAEAGFMFPLLIALGWLAGQTLILYGALLTHYPTGTALFYTGLVLVFKLLIVFIANLGAQQTRARRELIEANSELRATQSLLADSIRAAERARISRELHDLLGHHLTALSLNLEVAEAAEGDAAQTHIRKSRSITMSLLEDVRSVVSDLRDDEGVVDLAAAVRALTEGIPSLEIHTSCRGDLSLDDPERAQNIVRIVQEIITNTIRHAEADNLWIDLEGGIAEFQLRTRDDGRAVRRQSVGYGLKTMQERVERLGGGMRVVRGMGWRVEVNLPRRSE